MITFTKSSLPFGWMGNMCMTWNDERLTINHNDFEWSTSEHLFQAMRFDDSKIITQIKFESNPIKAKQIAKSNLDKMTVIPLSKQDILNMSLCLSIKLEQHPLLVDELLKTDGKIIENVTARIGDHKSSSLFWGAALIQNKYWIGMNVLGNIFMHFRHIIKEFGGVSILKTYIKTTKFVNFIDEILNN